MTRNDFEVLAAGHFLCDGELEISEQWELLQKDRDIINDKVIVLVNFEHTLADELIENIISLADDFEEVFKLGEKNVLKKI